MINKICKLGMLMLSILIFNGCSSDDDDSNNNDSTGIVGTWKITSLTLESTTDWNQDGVANPNLLEETSCSLNDFFIFNADGTGEVVSDGFSIVLDVDQDVDFNNYYTFECVDYSGYTLDSTWTQEGNSVTVVTVVETIVLSLESNDLIGISEDSFQVPKIFSGGIGWDYVIEDSITTLTKI